ncbi:hypothetical protein F4679DRAFT_583562 [Xylaria curta]|nr:hypothetical protein F4679DRAFT_583562 [Xylaria curta]
MGAHTAAKPPLNAKKMRHQAPEVRKLRHQAPVNKTGETLNLKVLELSSNKWTYGPQEDKGASPSSVRGENPQEQVSEIRIQEPQSEADSWHTVSEAEKQQDDSDAISDTSFTPPKHLARCARYDDEGRRLPPPGLGDAAPKQQSRFVCGDEDGREHLMPPPGFHGALPKLIDEAPVALKFERKMDFKKDLEKRQGGASLVAMHKQSSRSEGKKKKKCSFEVSTSFSSVSKEEQSASYKKLAESPTAGRLIEGWESAFLKGVFDAEEDLLYSSRWPASSF